MVDPIYECELALELRMSLSELRHGRGTPMTAYELLIEWPRYFETRRRMDKRAKDAEKPQTLGGGVA